MTIWGWSGDVAYLLMVCFPLRRQFCCERLPPERDGGVWEVQPGGPQAEEHAGTSHVCLYSPPLHTDYLLERQLMTSKTSFNTDYRTFPRVKQKVASNRSSDLFWQRCFYSCGLLLCIPSCFTVCATFMFGFTWRKWKSVCFCVFPDGMSLSGTSELSGPDCYIPSAWNMSWELLDLRGNCIHKHVWRHAGVFAEL